MQRFIIRLFCCVVPNRHWRHLIRQCRFGRYKIIGTNNRILFQNKLLPKWLKIPGVKVVITGNNSTVKIGKHSTLENITIDIQNDNVHISLGDSLCLRNIYMRCAFAENQKIIIGSGTHMYGGSISCDEPAGVIIGKNCLFASGVRILSSDGHALLNKDTNEIIKIPIKDIQIDNNVWVGAGVYILKDVHIASNNIIGTNSLVNKSFTEEHTVIAGSPARIVKRNISWSSVNPTYLSKTLKEA